jgi:hypothetical protein
MLKDIKEKRMCSYREKDFNDNTHNLRKIVERSNIKSKIDIEDEIDLPSSYSSDSSD